MHTGQLVEGLKTIGIDGQVLPYDYFHPDLLLNQPSRPKAFILNTGLSSSPGYHWICFYRPKTISKQVVVYFDSYGLPQETYFQFQFPRNIIYEQNSHVLQMYDSNFCGHYCLTFLDLRHKYYGHTKDIISEFFDVHNSNFNDQRVKKYSRNKFCHLYSLRRNDQCCETCQYVIRHRLNN